jgi:hypothetical protein
MEYYEGASYKINIEGYDSTLILDGYTRTLKANVIDQNDNIMVDHETGTLYGTLVGDIVDAENNLIYDSGTNTISVEQIKGSIVDQHGSVVFDYHQSLFQGKFEGEFSGNILSGDTLVYDQGTNTVNASLHGSVSAADGTLAYNHETNTFTGNFVGNLEGNIISKDIVVYNSSNNTMSANLYGNLFNVDGGMAYDHERNIFQGTFVGNFVDQDGNLLFSSSDTTQNFGDNIILYTDGSTAIDLITKTLTGNLWGNVVTQEGNVLLNEETQSFHGSLHGHVFNNGGSIIIDADTNTVIGNLWGNVVTQEGYVLLDEETQSFHGSLHGHVFSKDGSIIIDTDTNTVIGNLVGNIYSADGYLLFDNENFQLNTNVNGNVISADGTVIVDTITGTILGTVVGSISGDILNSEGIEIFSSDNGTFNIPITADVFGSVTGNIYDNDGNFILDSEEKSLSVNTITCNSITTTVIGPLVGDILDIDGFTVFDLDSKEFSGNLIGDIVGINGQVRYSAETGTFTGTFIGDFAGSLTTNKLQVVHPNAEVVIANDRTMDDDGTFSVLTYSDSTDVPGGIILGRGRGTVNDPKSTQVGDKLSSIVFTGVIEDGCEPDNPKMAPVAYLETEVDQGNLENNKLPGKISCYVFNTNPTDDDIKLGWSVNSEGEFRATLADVTIVGETSNNPVTTSSPSKWLELTVNGETCYMPLYT